MAAAPDTVTRAIAAMIGAMSTTTDVAHLRDFKPDNSNARLHDERNLAAIETSLQTTGFGRPILAAKDGTVLAGNATLEAAGNIGMEDAILVHSDGTKPIIHVRTDLDPDSEMARLAAFYDNRTAELASWDTEVLAALMQETDIAPVAMTPEEAADLIAAGEPEPVVGNTDPDEVPEPPVEPTTRPGDLWRLGEHRLLCGDSTKAEDVARLMAGEQARILFTDPPYGIGLNIENDNLSEDGLQSFNQAWVRCAWPVLAMNASGVIFGSTRTFPASLDAARAAGFEFLRMLTIYKPNDMTFPWRGWLLTSEAILLFQKGKAAFLDVHPYAHDCYLQNHGAATLSEDIGGHPAAKPFPVIADLLSRLSGEVVYDPFLGSGTTLIAAEQLGRRCYGMEIDPVYADVIVRRWEQFTGGTAELEQAP